MSERDRDVIKERASRRITFICHLLHDRGLRNIFSMIFPTDAFINLNRYRSWLGSTNNEITNGVLSEVCVHQPSISSDYVIQMGGEIFVVLLVQEVTDKGDAQGLLRQEPKHERARQGRHKGASVPPGSPYICHHLRELKYLKIPI